MTTNEMLLRGCMLKNSNYVLGLVVYTGKESRIQMNAAKTPNKVGETLALACAPLQCLHSVADPTEISCYSPQLHQLPALSAILAGTLQSGKTYAMRYCAAARCRLLRIDKIWPYS